MTKIRTNLGAVAFLAIVLPASLAAGQYSGVSHPDEVPAVTTQEAPAEPVYRPTPTIAPVSAPAAPELKPRTVASYEPSAPNRPYNPDAHIVGDEIPSPAESEADLDRNVVTHVDGPANGLAAGATFRTRMLQSFSTKTTAEGSEWQAELVEPMMREGRVLVPTGSIVRGRVTEVHGGRRITGVAMLHLEPIAVTLPDGSSLALHAQVIDTSLYHSTKIDGEGSILHRDHKKEEAAVLALTAGSGAAAGAVLAGVPGALIGAGIGAGVSTAIWLKEDRQAELPRDTQVTFELTRPMSVGLQ